MLKTAGTGAKYGAYAGMSALSAYMLYSSYQEHGKEGLFKELVAQGLGWSFPPAFVAQLAGIAVKASGEYGLDLVRQYKEDAAYRALLGTSYGDLIKAWQNGNGRRVALGRRRDGWCRPGTPSGSIGSRRRRAVAAPQSRSPSRRKRERSAP
jgi:hypothetical protein